MNETADTEKTVHADLDACIQSDQSVHAEKPRTTSPWLEMSRAWRQRQVMEQGAMVLGETA